MDRPRTNIEKHILAKRCTIIKYITVNEMNFATQYYRVL